MKPLDEWISQIKSILMTKYAIADEYADILIAAYKIRENLESKVINNDNIELWITDMVVEAYDVPRIHRVGDCEYL